MLDKNKKLIEEQNRLEKSAYTGQTVIHWLKGVAKYVDFPKKPVRKEIIQSERVGGTENG